MQKQTIQVLYVDDDVDNLTCFKTYFRGYFSIFTAASTKEAEKIFSLNEIHVLITDQKLSETGGTRLLEDAVRKYPEQTRILLTGYADNEAIIDAFQKGLIYRYVLKPYKYEDLKEIIDNSYEIYILKKIKDVLYKEWIKTQVNFDLLKKNKFH